MKYRNTLRVAAVLITGVLAAGCTAGGSSSSGTQKSSHKPVTLSLWTFYTGRELKTFESILNGVKKQAPWITVKVTGGKQLADIQRAINSGTAPDVAMEVGPDDVAKYCSSGAWIDLNPYAKQDGMSLDKVVIPSALQYTSYQGKQCALPVLTDAYGLYYNIDLLKKAGIKSPPKTYSELFADAKKLTVKNSDGSIKVAGFVPLSNFYETPQIDNGVWSDADWYDSNGKSALGSDPDWAKLVAFQKNMVDYFGFDNLSRFFADLGGANSEWNSTQAFQQGKIAMALDGEWRVAFIKDNHSDVHYATAPFPVADDHASNYGSGQIGGTIIGIPRNTASPADSWEVVKYLATDTGAETALARAIRNVPTTFDALKDPVLNKDPNFQTFLKIYANPDSRYKQVTPLGTVDVDLFVQWLGKYLANGGDLQQGLNDVASRIDDQKQLG